MPEPKTIVLIHGFWVTPRSWEHWIAHYEGKGHACWRPPTRARGRGRGAERRPDADRGADAAGDRRAPGVRDRRAGRAADPDRALGGWRDHPDPARPRPRGLRGRDELGADRGGADRPADPGQGRLAGAEEPVRMHRAVALDYEQWHYTFTNTFPEEESKATYERYAIPASGTIFWASVLANLQPGHQDTWVDYHNDDRAPLLFMSGERGPPHAAIDPAVERQALQVRHDHRGQGVRGQGAPDAGPGGLGGDRRLRPRRGRPSTPRRRLPAEPGRGGPWMPSASRTSAARPS